MNEIKERPITNIERLFYRAPFCDVIMMARFGRSINDELLGKALNKARLKYPLMGARIERDGDGATRFVFDKVPEFQIKVLDKKDEIQWLESAWNEQKEPFDLNKGPLIKFLLLRSTDGTDLVVICHHSICDGLSLTYLIKNIASFLEDPGTKINPQPLPPVLNEDSFSVRIQPTWYYKILLNHMNHSWKKEKVIFNDDDYTKLYKEYWQKTNIGITLFNLSREATSTLISRCHKEHIIVNSALTTAFALAQYYVQGKSPGYLRKALIDVNIRSLLKNYLGDNFGLFASGILITLPDRKGDFWSTIQKFNMKFKHLLSNPTKVLGSLTLDYLDPTLIDAVYFAAYSHFKSKTVLRVKKLMLPSTDKPKRSLGITNLGNVNIEKNSYNLNALFFVPQISPNYEKVIGIITADNEMHITVLYDRCRIGSDIIEKFKQRTVAYLTEGLDC
jgi:NRPS condensation-like uncharacterized protein